MKFETITCGACNGERWIDGNQCRICHGSGTEKMRKPASDKPYPELESMMSEKEMLDVLMERLSEGRFQANGSVAEVLKQHLKTDTELLDFFLPILFGPSTDTGAAECAARLRVFSATWEQLKKTSEATMLPALLEPRYVLTMSIRVLESFRKVLP